MENFPTNANVAKDAPAPDEKKIEKIVTGEVIQRKPSLGKRFSQTFFGGDAKGAWGYVLWDVMLPAAKDMLADAASQGVERMIFGEAKSTSRRTGARPGTHNSTVSYNRMSSSQGRPEPRQEISRRNRSQHKFDDIVLATRVEGEEVIDRLFEIVSRYGSATVSDLYELLGVTASHTDNKWGWLELRGAGVSRTRDGYLLDLPNPEPLD